MSVSSEIIKKFSKAFNEHDIESLVSLLDDECRAISSSGKVFYGKKQIKKIYEQLTKKLGYDARYKPGGLNDKQTVFVYHRRSGKWVIQSVKKLVIRQGLIVEIQSLLSKK